jgi:multidrug efflux pump subunit AcrB
MNFAAYIERHARSIILVALALAIAGVVSAISLPVGLFPQVAFPRIVVDLDAGSRPADQTALLVTRPVEETIRTVPGVIDVRSASSRGTAQISVDFGWGRDMVSSTLLVDAAVSQILPNLPSGTGYNVRRMDPTVFPIISYALLSDSTSPVTLHDLAQYQIVPLLSAISGLARVSVQGGETAEVEVLADPHRLAGYGLGTTDLSDALTKANVMQAVGQLQDNHKLYLVTADHSIGKAEAVGDVVVRFDQAGVVRVRDVATVQDGVVPQWVRVVEDGKPAVLFSVYEQPDGNAVQCRPSLPRSTCHPACAW